MKQPNNLTRRELYELIWSKPLYQVYNLLSLTNQELKLICKKNNIPIPEMGYWQKLKFNKVVSKIPLTNKSTSDKKIELKAEKEVILLQKICKDIQEKCSTSLIIPSKLKKPHNLIVSTKNHWENLKKRDYRIRAFQLMLQKIVKVVH